MHPEPARPSWYLSPLPDRAGADSSSIRRRRRADGLPVANLVDTLPLTAVVASSAILASIGAEMHTGMVDDDSTPAPAEGWKVAATRSPPDRLLVSVLMLNALRFRATTVTLLIAVAFVAVRWWSA